MELVSLANKYTQSVTTSSPASSIKMFFKLFKKKNYNKCSTKKKSSKHIFFIIITSAVPKNKSKQTYPKKSTKNLVQSVSLRTSANTSDLVHFLSNKYKHLQQSVLLQ